MIIFVSVPYRGNVLSNTITQTADEMLSGFRPLSGQCSIERNCNTKIKKAVYSFRPLSGQCSIELYQEILRQNINKVSVPYRGNVLSNF